MSFVFGTQEEREKHQVLMVDVIKERWQQAIESKTVLIKPADDPEIHSVYTTFRNDILNSYCNSNFFCSKIQNENAPQVE